MDPKPARLALPDEPSFKAFFQHFKSSPNRPTFHDYESDIEADYTQFLQDVYATQIGLLSVKSTGCKDCPYVFLLNPCNYEFAVAAFAILATGLAVVPLGKFPIYSQAYRTDGRRSPSDYARRSYTFDAHVSIDYPSHGLNYI